MSLLYTNTSDRVVVTDATSIQNADPYSFFMWFYLDTFTASRTLFHKNATGGLKSLQLNGTTEVRFRTTQTTGGCDSITSNCSLTTGKWWFMACTFNSSASAGTLQNVYLGDLSTLASARTYSTRTEGTGGAASDSGNNMVVGCNPAFTTAIQGRIAVFGYLKNKELSLGEIRALQFFPYPLATTSVLFQFGFNGTGTQPDLSGHFNTGAVTGATQSFHVPLMLNGPVSYSPYVVAAATGWGHLLGMRRNQLVQAAA